MAKVRAITAKIDAAAFHGIEASGIPDRDIAQMSAAVIDVFRSKNDMHNADWFYASHFDDDKDIDPNSQLLCRRALQLRRCYCKQERSFEKYQAILRRYVRSSKQQPPVWYHDIEEHGIKAPETFPTPQQHPSRKSTNENWKMDLMEEGPIGLLILAALRAGLKIDNQFCIWQQKEEPVDVLNIPYQCLQPQLLQMLARARTRARSQAEGDKPSLKGLTEIDQIATKVSKQIGEEDKGIIRTVSSGGGMTTGDIAGWNEDAETMCTYCMTEDNDIDHLIWDCPFFNKVRVEQDPLLA